MLFSVSCLYSKYEVTIQYLRLINIIRWDRILQNERQCNPMKKDRQTDRSDLSWLSTDIVWKMTGRKTRYDCLESVPS